MTTEKFIAFMEKLLEKTKSGKIDWRRYIPGGAEKWVSPTRSFVCTAGTMEVFMLCSEDLEVIHLYIKYDSTFPMAGFSVEGPEAKQVALRLVNYVYSIFPNLEESIDKFLREP